MKNVRQTYGSSGANNFVSKLPLLLENSVLMGLEGKLWLDSAPCRGVESLFGTIPQ